MTLEQPLKEQVQDHVADDAAFTEAVLREGFEAVAKDGEMGSE